MKRLLSTLAFIVIYFAAIADNGVEIVQDWGTLRGDHICSEGKKQRVVIFIAGSGPTDRNGNQPSMQTYSYRQLADSLFAYGISSILYDKRGIAASQYNNPSDLLSDCHFYHYVNDASMLVDYASQLGYDEIALAGHSEGSLIALLVAQQNDKVDRVISLAGAGRSIDKIVMLQLMGQLISVDYSLYTRACRILDTLRRGEKPTDVPKQLASLFPEYLNNFWSEEISHDPCKVIANLPEDVDVMIVGGSTDVQVAVDNAHLLHRARPQSRLEIVDGMCHTLKLSDGRTAAEQIDAYTNPSLPVAQRLVDVMVEFLLGQ